MSNSSKIRFAVLGLGHIAQNAVLPSFKHASEKCELTALISDDSEKLTELGKLYKVENRWSYAQLDQALASKSFDAIYIALPNDLHKQFAIKAANAGVHILCEKPMALNEEECREMIQISEKNRVKLMIAYRLHFEKTNMDAVDLVRQGKIGVPKVFNSTFTMQVREGNIRTMQEHGGGPLNDIGIYCINAARYIFGTEPTEVVALAAKSADPRFVEIDESVSVILRFPNNCLASFVCSFGSKDESCYEVVGAQGSLTLKPAFDYVEELKYTLQIGDQVKKGKTPKRDQFAPELLHLADCILENKEPNPSGYEGLNDVIILDAIRKSLDSRQVVAIENMFGTSPPDGSLILEKPGVSEPKLVNVETPSLKI